MTLYGGTKGLLENEKNICRFPQFANARLIGQNNLGEAIMPRLQGEVPKKTKAQAQSATTEGEPMTSDRRTVERLTQC